MKKTRGFTLLELLVLVAIIALLAGLFYLGYDRVISRQRYNQMFSFLSIAANAKRNQMIKTPHISVRGRLQNVHNTSGSCLDYDTNQVLDPSYLIACGYLQPERWDNANYDINLCDAGWTGGCCATAAADVIACSDFVTTEGTWQYYINQAGDCTSSAGAIPCPTDFR